MKTRSRYILAVSCVLGLGMGAALSACQSAAQSAVAGGANPTAAATATAIAPGTGNQASRQRGQAPVSGIVTGLDQSGFTVKNDSGGDSVVVHTGSNTVVRKQVNGLAADLKPGDTITVRGAAQADGTIGATSIQRIDGAGGFPPFGGQGQAPGQGQGSGTPGPGQGQRRPSGTPGAGGFGSQANANVVVGTIKDIAGGVISVARSGSASGQDVLVKVSLSDKTTILETTTRVLSDVTVGAHVMVNGPRGDDGAITASSVQIVPSDATSASSRGQQSASS